MPGEELGICQFSINNSLWDPLAVGRNEGERQLGAAVRRSVTPTWRQRGLGTKNRFQLVLPPPQLGILLPPTFPHDDGKWEGLCSTQQYADIIFWVHHKNGQEARWTLFWARNYKGVDD